MTKVERLTRRNLILGVVALLLVGYLVLRPPETSAEKSTELPALCPSLQAADARALTLRRAPVLGASAAPAAAVPAEIRLVRGGDDTWLVASKFDYPASAERVTSFLEALAGARVKKVVTERAETFDEYAGPDGWTDVEVLDATGKAMARFQMGKSAGWPDGYVLMTGDDGTRRVIRAYNLTPESARVDVSDWTEERLWPGLSLPAVARIDVFQRDEKQTLSFSQQASEPEPFGSDPAEGAPPPVDIEVTWRMLAPEETEANTMAVEGLIRQFTGMRMADVVGLSENPPAGFEDPAYRVVVTSRLPDPPPPGRAEAPRFVLEVGPEVTDGEDGAPPTAYLVRRADDVWTFRIPAYAISDFRKTAADFLPEPRESADDEGAPSDEPGSKREGAPPADDQATGNPDEEATGGPDGAPPPDDPGAGAQPGDG